LSLGVVQQQEGKSAEDPLLHQLLILLRSEVKEYM